MKPHALQTQVNLEEGPAKEIKVLVNDEKRKLVSVALRREEIFAEHSTKTPLIIYCSQGNGLLRVGEEVLSLTPGVVVPLDAEVVHAVEAHPAVALLLTLFRG